MRILGAVDLHGSPAAIRSLSRHLNCREVDALLLAGDITNAGDPGYVEQLMAIIPDCITVIAVLGNIDPPEVADELKEAGITVLSGTTTDLDGYTVVGATGKDDSESLTYLVEDGCILVTHHPPKGILDHAGATSIGEESLLRLVTHKSPLIHLFGHAHESPGVERNEQTFFVNPGPAMWGNVALIEVGEGIETKVLLIK